MDIRKFWVDTLIKIVNPVLSNMADDNLKAVMPIKSHYDINDRMYCTYIEALGRTMLGLSSWFNAQDIDSDEKELQAKYLDLACRSISNAVNSECNDFVYTKKDNQFLPQIVVDTAFLAYSFIRAKESLWDKLDNTTKQNLIFYFKQTRQILPYSNNWILFSCMIEAFFYLIGEEYDLMRIDYGFKQFEQWYVGDGFYKDGKVFHLDYYNSYVIQPFLIDILRTIKPVYRDSKFYEAKILERARRYSKILERSINSDGSFPSYGRSITYRSGAFHHLANMCLLNLLPEDIDLSALKTALTKNIEKCFYSEGTFDKDGWLNIGLYGNQPNLGESYISQGSLYLCTTIFLPLGLDRLSPFWKLNQSSNLAERLLNGENLKKDESLD